MTNEQRASNADEGAATVTQAREWEPTTWRSRPAEQLPDWPDDKALLTARAELATLPPLVFAGEARTLQRRLGTVAEGKAFVLQAGDCAESFTGVTADEIRDKLKVILQMAVVLTYASGLPVVKIGRIAGQFAKPRSSPTERVGDVEMPSFRGHIVNDDAPFPAARVPDPNRMVRAYNHSSATLNLLRAFTKGGFADLSQVHIWNQQFVASSAEGRRYEAIAGEIDRALAFMRACGIDLSAEAPIQQVDFFTSHEALLLDYEEALTRRDSLTGDWYDCSAHMLWVGERAPARRRPRPVPLRREEPDRRQARADGDPRRGTRALRAVEPRPDTRSPHAHHPARCRKGHHLTWTDRARRHRRRPPRRMGVRPDARQHLQL